MLLTTIQAIQSLENLKPSRRVNNLFTQLVQEVIAAPPEILVDNSTRRNMQRIASAAETEMELFWARNIIASANPAKVLAAFPYRDNYHELIRREISLVEGSGRQLSEFSHVLMIGTGPLPMTGLELMSQRNVRIDHIDTSLTALAICSLVGNRLGLSCGHILGDGASVSLADQYDLIIVAALAGETTAQKQAIIDNVLPSLARDGRLLLRSAYGARTLLYPGIIANDFSHVELLEEYHPQDEIINSIFVYEKEHHETKTVPN